MYLLFPFSKPPLRDGDLERPDDAAYAGCYFVNANSATAPGIVDADRQPILDRSEVYSGVYGRASINFYAFNSNGNKGIACGLNNLQKIKDGEPLGGKSRAEDDFATDADEDFLRIRRVAYYDNHSEHDAFRVFRCRDGYSHCKCGISHQVCH